MTLSTEIIYVWPDGSWVSPEWGLDLADFVATYGDDFMLVDIPAGQDEEQIGKWVEAFQPHNNHIRYHDYEENREAGMEPEDASAHAH